MVLYLDVIGCHTIRFILIYLVRDYNIKIDLGVQICYNLMDFEEYYEHFHILMTDDICLITMS